MVKQYDPYPFCASAHLACLVAITQRTISNLQYKRHSTSPRRPGPRSGPPHIVPRNLFGVRFGPLPRSPLRDLLLLAVVADSATNLCVALGAWTSSLGAYSLARVFVSASIDLESALAHSCVERAGCEFECCDDRSYVALFRHSYQG